MAPDNGFDLFDTIQEGVDAVAEGGKVSIAAGLYEEQITVGKNIRLEGAPGVIVDPGEGPTTALQVSSANVIMIGLKIRNAEVGVMGDGSASLGIYYSTVTGTTYGLRISDSADAEIHNSNLVGNKIFAVDALGTSASAAAENTWWGASDGPSGQGTGSGDSITANVTYTPYLSSHQLRDSDGDGLYDWIEDLDLNGIQDTGETNPTNKDTDGDGVEDGVEVALSYDPTNSGSVPPSPPGTGDSDGDGYKDFYEVAIGTSPNEAGETPSLGDSNDSGAADNVDAIIIFNSFLANVAVTDYFPDRTDVNRDGRIDNVDAIILLNWFLGNIAAIPQ